MKKLIVVLGILFFASMAYADNPLVQKVEVSPLTGGISFNTVTTSSVIGWVTAPSVEMRGRIRVALINNSSTNNFYLTGVSGSTSIGTLAPGKTAVFAAAYGNHIFVSANTVTPISIDVWEVR